MDSISCWLRWYNGYPTVAVGVDAKMRKCDPKQSPIRVVLRPSNVNYATKPLQKENPKTFSNFVSIYALAGWLCQVLYLSHLILNVIRTPPLGKCRSNVTSVPPYYASKCTSGCHGNGLVSPPFASSQIVFANTDIKFTIIWLHLLEKLYLSPT